MTTVCDASALVAALADAGAAGAWAADHLRGRHVGAPALIDWEVANVLRRQELAGHLSSGEAAQAHADLLDLPLQRFPYDVLAGRCWELRANLSMYDASYVALAELLDAPLVTLDARLGRVPGVRCQVMAP